MRRNLASWRRVLVAESLESRTLLSEAATASVALVSTAGTGTSVVYAYDITLKDVGTTAIGTFWFGWIPGEDFMHSMPTAVGDPSGWGHAVTNFGSLDGFAIQWVASSNAMSAGQTLSGFTFSSADSPSAIAGNSTFYPTTPVGTFFVYSAGPFSDTGAQFVAQVAMPASLVVTAPAAQSATAGASKSISLGSVTAANTTAPYSVDVNWGDGSTDTKFSVTSPGAIPAKAHTFAKAATDAVSVTVTDSASHTSNKAKFNVTVAAAPASLVVTGPSAQTATAGASKSFALGSFKETGATGPYSIDVNWGDGSVDTKFSLATVGTITAQNHTFTKAATDAVSVTITDAAKHTSNKTTFNVSVTQSITGTVFVDANANGKLDSGEKGLSGVKVYIDTKKTGAFVTGDPNTTTNSAGAFTFTNQASGTYRIREVLPTGYAQTAPTAGFLDTVLSGTGAKGLLFADAPATASISGTVFGDTNGDGKIDNNELGVGLWQVFIDTNNNGKLESTEKVVTTNISGTWSFTGLVAGTYIIRVVPVNGAVATKPTGGVSTVILTAGQASTGHLFGERAIA